MGRKRSRVSLNVFVNQALVGTLERSSTGAISFRYAENWLASEESYPISYSMRLREQPYRGETVNAYFDNLLPDNESIRKAIAARVRAPSISSFDLLAALGRDCVGALQFFPDSQTPRFSKTLKARELSEKEIATLLRSLARTPLGITSTEEFRLSIAGAQEKTALLLKNGKWCLPLEATPTSHIFKVRLGKLPNGIDLSTSIENEWFCLKAAQHLGLPVTSATIDKFEDTDCLIVERFDRKWSPQKKSLLRLPQEDLCQALGVPSTLKYESDGGPGVPEIMNFLDGSDHRDRDRAIFLRAQLVFFLLAATDGHAKNFSIFLHPNGFELTPLYDILTVASALKSRQLEKKEARLAMSAGDNRHRRLNEIQARHWQQTARTCGFSGELLQELLADLARRVKTLPQLIKILPAEFPTRLAEDTIEYATRQMEKLE